MTPILLLALSGPALADWRCLDAAPAEGFVPLAAAPPPPSSLDTCWGQQAAWRVTGRIAAVEYDAPELGEAARALAEAMDRAWDALVQDQGWPGALAEDGLLLAYVDARDGGGAYTTRGTCPDGRRVPYMVAFADALRDPEDLADVATHELNHFHHFDSGAAHEAWWWEASATAAQALAHPEHALWRDLVDRGYLAQPQLPLRASSREDPAEALHMYGMALFALHLVEAEGAAALVETWTLAPAEPGPLPALLDAMGLDFEALYADFVARVAAGELDPALAEVAFAATLGALPAAARVDGALAPGALGQAFLRLTPPEDPEHPDLGLTLVGDGAAGWWARVVGVSEGRAARVEAVAWRDGVGEARLEGFDRFDEVVVVASPTREGAWPLDLSLEALPARADGAATPGEPAPSAPGARPLDPPAGACAAAPTPARGLLLALALALLRRRTG